MTKTERRAAGRCWDCDDEAAPNRTRCTKHLRSSAKGADHYSRTPKGQQASARRKPYMATWRRKHRRAKGRFAYVRRHAIARGHTWSLTPMEYALLVTGNCAYCGMESDVEAGVGLDRLDNSKGYEVKNVVCCCSFCNMARGARFTPEEMIKLGKVIAEIRLARKDGR
jgi:hypothetical protein